MDREWKVQSRLQRPEPWAAQAVTSTLKRPFLFLGRILILAALAVSIVFSGRFTSFVQGYGLLFVLLGAVAMAFMGFSLLEIGAAFKHAAGVPGNWKEIRTSALFWESSARNVWMLGVLGSIINFVAALSNSQGGIANIASRMALSLVPTVYGMVLGVICMVPAWKLTEELRHQSPEEAQAVHRSRHTAGISAKSGNVRLSFPAREQDHRYKRAYGNSFSLLR